MEKWMIPVIVAGGFLILMLLGLAVNLAGGGQYCGGHEVIDGVDAMNGVDGGVIGNDGGCFDFGDVTVFVMEVKLV
ncbi:hypothetical protein V6N12_035947 [Hibiscus sabdariffa]|uniref:Glycine-rich protein n=1 Tax=Hibiscus sabdariffa TaxID=183260 RepID=A0ABR2EPL2_9ROSI